MQYLIYILVYPVLWIVSKLPFNLLYLTSNMVYFFVYYIFSYRKNIVRKNIALTLPHLSYKEKIKIEKKFYLHMCDMFLEMIKTMSISKEEIQNRFSFTNLDEFKKYTDNNKSIIILYAHYASWEWSISFSTFSEYKSIGIYKRIRNKYFDNLIKKIRSRFNAYLVDTKNTIDLITDNELKKIKAVYGFISDQSPKISKATYWENFMGYNVPVFTGAEMMARKFDMNVVYMKIEKIKRGFYIATFIPITNNINNLPENVVTKTFINEVEKQILAEPSYYFWTHKRWKHIKN